MVPRKARYNVKHSASREVEGNAHWAIKRLFKIIQSEQVSLVWLGDRTGITRETISTWRRNGNPSLMNIEACFNALGYKFLVKKIRNDDGS